MSSHKPKRSNFDLICGMILGGLVVGIMTPIVSKNFGNAENSAKRSFRARAPITHDMKSPSVGKDKAKEKIVASANVEPARIAGESETKPNAEKGEAENPEAKAVAGAGADVLKFEANKPKSKVVRSEDSRSRKPEKPKADVRSARLERVTESLEEISNSASAELVASKTDSALIESGLTATHPGEGKIIITGARYSKDQLRNCEKRCLLKSIDAKGNLINAIISGPAFADVLREHQGTINITGVKRVVKNYEIFLVQNITFNLPSKDQTIRAQIPPSNMPKKNAKSTWEDLSEDLKTR